MPPAIAAAAACNAASAAERRDGGEFEIGDRQIGDEILGGGGPGAHRNHDAVDIGGRQPCVCDRLQRRFQLQIEPRPARSVAGIPGFADAGDRRDIIDRHRATAEAAARHSILREWPVLWLQKSSTEIKLPCQHELWRLA
jgi:hypothetical protein